MMGLLAAALLAGQAPATVAGVYETRQMEVGATIELKKDGTFRYMLDYGAVSEAAEGHWTTDKGLVHLESDPLATNVMMQLERSDAAFHDEQLAIDQGALVMRRYDTLFTFYRDDE
jgi:hypothetical protein